VPIRIILIMSLYVFKIVYFCNSFRMKFYSVEEHKLCIPFQILLAFAFTYFVVLNIIIWIYVSFTKELLRWKNNLT